MTATAKLAFEVGDRFLDLASDLQWALATSSPYLERLFDEPGAAVRPHDQAKTTDRRLRASTCTNILMEDCFRAGLETLECNGMPLTGRRTKISKPVPKLFAEAEFAERRERGNAIAAASMSGRCDNW